MNQGKNEEGRGRDFIMGHGVNQGKNEEGGGRETLLWDMG